MRAQRAVISNADPFILGETTDTTTVRDTNAKTLSSQTLNLAIRNCIFICAGQSNWTNVAPSHYTPSNPTNIDQLNAYDGAIYRAADPLLGTSNAGGHPATILADNMITADWFDRVIIVPISINGTLVTDWDTGVLFDRIPATIRRLAARNLTATAILWGQGEGATEGAGYAAKLNSVITKTRTAGFAGPWFVAQQTWQAGATNATIRAQQASTWNSAASVFQGPDADTLDATKRISDNTHFNDAGAAAYAVLWANYLTLYGPPFAA